MRDITNIDSKTFTYNVKEFKDILIEHMDSINSLFKVYFSYANKYSKYYTECVKYKDKKLLSLVTEYHFYQKIKSPYRNEDNIVENIKTLSYKIENRIKDLKEQYKRIKREKRSKKETKNTRKPVPVAMLDDNGKVLKTFDSIYQAFKYLNKNPNNAIKIACDTKKKMLGYYWKRI